MLKDEDLIAAIGRLGRITVHWYTDKGNHPETREQLDRLFKSGALDRATYSTIHGVDTSYFLPQAIPPIPSWAIELAPYPMEATP